MAPKPLASNVQSVAAKAPQKPPRAVQPSIKPIPEIE